MSINLQKGQKVDLTKGTNLSRVCVGLGWSANMFNGADFDLDASVFMTAANGRCQTDRDFIFYGNLQHNSGSVTHLGDNLVGGGGGDDEQISVDLKLVPQNIDKIVFTVTIYDAAKRNQNFGLVSNAFIRICDESNGFEIMRYDLGEDFSIETAVTFGELYRNNGEWKFNPIGAGFQGGLPALCNAYGIQTTGG